MPRHIVLLRGINIGPRNRVAMPALRERLTAAGLHEVTTYLQSGNVVLSSDASATEVADRCRAEIAAGFGLDFAVVTRTRDELAAVVALNPLGEAALDPKRYQVSFLAGELPAATVDKLTAALSPPEQLVIAGREVYVWHPEGVARSPLWAQLGGPRLGVTATARNWTTVTSLLALAAA